MPELSVIVPVYNMEKDGALQYCLDSLIAQTLDDMEIIAVDDRSTDGSLGILNDYEKRYPGKVKVIASPKIAGRVVPEIWGLPPQRENT